MPFGVDDAIVAGAALYGALRQPKKPNYGKIINAYRNARPQGYLSEADLAEGERIRARGTASAVAGGQLARQRAVRSVIARRLQGPAAAALTQTANETEAAGREHAYDVGSQFLDSRFQNNLGYERNKLDRSFQAQIGAESQNAAYSAAQEAGMWNSMLDVIPAISGAWSPAQAAPAVTGGGATYDPSAAPKPVRPRPV